MHYTSTEETDFPELVRPSKNNGLTVDKNEIQKVECFLVIFVNCFTHV
jgi:hypothetical protein